MFGITVRKCDTQHIGNSMLIPRVVMLSVTIESIKLGVVMLNVVIITVPRSSDWRLSTAVTGNSRMKAGNLLHLSKQTSPVH